MAAHGSGTGAPCLSLPLTAQLRALSRRTLSIAAPQTTPATQSPTRPAISRSRCQAVLQPPLRHRVPPRRSPRLPRPPRRRRLRRRAPRRRCLKTATLRCHQPETLTHLLVPKKGASHPSEKSMERCPPRARRFCPAAQRGAGEHRRDSASLPHSPGTVSGTGPTRTVRPA